MIDHKTSRKSCDTQKYYLPNYITIKIQVSYQTNRHKQFTVNLVINGCAVTDVPRMTETSILYLHTG